MKRLSLALLVLLSAAYLVSTRRPTWLSPLGAAVSLGDGAIWASRGGDFHDTAGFYSYPYVDFDSGRWTVLDRRDAFAVFSSGTGVAFIRLPLWPAAVFVVPLFFFAWWRSVLPIPHGHCRKCWYDLREIPRAPDGNVTCPECGGVGTSNEETINL